VHEIESLIFLLAAAALLAQLARLLKVPYPILLVLGGLVLGFVPGLPDIEIPPEVIFVVFLPPLLNSAAFSSSPLDLRAQLRPIVLLAVGLVLATMGAVAVIAHALIGLPWAAAFVLGAILAPTDPVAAEAIFGRLGVPERVGTVVSGESLVNDGTGLVAFRVAVAAVISGAFSVWEAGLSFLLIGGGGMLVGLALARILLPLWARLREPTVVITFSEGLLVVGDGHRRPAAHDLDPAEPRRRRGTLLALPDRLAARSGYGLDGRLALSLVGLLLRAAGRPAR
jgi:NhaP-type Na+/H+ or K+/H+ antiporter